jgi:hypothetical protein
MSDVGLAKACARMMIPVPGRGYWAKKEVGRSPRPTRLPTLPAGAGNEKRELHVRRREAPKASAVAAEAPATISVVVPEALTEPHPLVAKSVKALRGGRVSHDGFLRPKTPDCLAVTVSMSCIDRAMRVYDAVIKTIEDRGYVVEVQQYRQAGFEQPRFRTVVLIDDEVVEVELIEVTRRVERRRDGPNDPSPKYETIPSGRLGLTIRSDVVGTRGRWTDEANRSLDDQLGTFIHGLAVAAVGLKEQRRAQQERERQQLESQQRAWEEADRRRAEAGRIRALNAEVDQMHSARWAREYLAALKSNVAANPEIDTASMQDWIAWVESYATRVDPFGRPAKIPKDPNPYG